MAGALGNIDAAQPRMIADFFRCIGIGHHPHVFTGIHVDSGDASVRRLDQRQPERPFNTETARHGVIEIAVLKEGVFRQADGHGVGRRGHVQHVGFRVESHSLPVGAATEAGHEQRAAVAFRLQCGWCVHRPVGIKIEQSHCLRLDLGRPVEQVVFTQSQALERRRLARERLRRRSLFAGHRRLRYRAFLDGPYRLAGQAVQRVHHPLLAHLDGGRDDFTVHVQVGQDGRGGGIVVPYVMMDKLEMPDAFTGFCIQRHQGLAEQVIAGTVAAVHIAGGGFHRHVDDAAFEIGRHRGPGTGVAGVGIRVVAPGFRAKLPGARNRVKDPQHFTRVQVVTANVAGRSGHGARRSARGERRADDDDVTDDHRRRGQAGRNVFYVDVESVFLPHAQVHHTVFAEGRIRFTGRRVERDEVVARGHRDDARLAALSAPVGHPAAGIHARAAPGALVVTKHPQVLAGNGIDGHHVAATPGRYVQHAVSHDRGGFVVEFGIWPVVERGPAPGDLQVADIVPVDLVKRRITGGMGVVMVAKPFVVDRALCT